MLQIEESIRTLGRVWHYPWRWTYTYLWFHNSATGIYSTEMCTHTLTTIGILFLRVQVVMTQIVQQINYFFIQWNNIQQQKWVNYFYVKQYGWILQTKLEGWLKVTRNKTIYIKLAHSY